MYPLGWQQQPGVNNGMTVWAVLNKSNLVFINCHPISKIFLAVLTLLV
jgi:hypothetical protein